MHNKTVHTVAFLLLVIGGLNWLLIGIFDWGIANITDQVSELLTTVIYILIGLAAVYELVTHKGSCTHCASKGASSDPAPSDQGGM